MLWQYARTQRLDQEERRIKATKLNVPFFPSPEYPPETRLTSWNDAVRQAVSFCVSLGIEEIRSNKSDNPYFQMLSKGFAARFERHTDDSTFRELNEFVEQSKVYDSYQCIYFTDGPVSTEWDGNVLEYNHCFGFKIASNGELLPMTELSDMLMTMGVSAIKYAASLSDVEKERFASQYRSY